MPKHTRGDIDVVVGHTLIIGSIDVAHVYQRVAHLVLSAVDEGVDNASDALVTHHVYVHGDAVVIGLARHLRQFLFGPVGTALMSVGIYGVYESRTSFYRTIHEEFDPIGFYAGRSVLLLNVAGLGQGLLHIHPTINLITQAQNEVQIACLVHLLGCLIEVGVIEIRRPAIDIHRVTLRQQVLLDI